MSERRHKAADIGDAIFRMTARRNEPTLEEGIIYFPMYSKVRRWLDVAGTGGGARYFIASLRLPGTVIFRFSSAELARRRRRRRQFIRRVPPKFSTSPIRSRSQCTRALASNEIALRPRRGQNA